MKDPYKEIPFLFDFLVRRVESELQKFERIFPSFGQNSINLKIGIILDIFGMIHKAYQLGLLIHYYFIMEQTEDQENHVP